MKLDKAAKQLEALGSPTRLAIYRLLVKAGQKGSPVGDIRQSLDIPASTLSHHIAKLVQAGLLIQKRDSRSLVCRLDYANMESLMAFLVNNCCSEDWYIQSD